MEKKNNKTENIIIRVTPEEKAMFALKANENGFKKVSEYIVSVVVSPFKFNRKKMQGMCYEINKLGVNLNQIAFRANKNKAIDAQVLQELKELNAKFDEVLEVYKKL